MDMKERLEVLEAVRHNLEQRLLSCCPEVRLETQAEAWEREAKRLLDQATKLRERLAEDRRDAHLLLCELRQAEHEHDLIRACLSIGIKDYNVVRVMLSKGL